jgi:hypothetical protein
MPWFKKSTIWTSCHHLGEIPPFRLNFLTLIKHQCGPQCLFPSTPTFTIPRQKLTPLCYRNAFLFSLAPLMCHLSLELNFKQIYTWKSSWAWAMEKNLHAPQVLLSAHAMKSPVLPFFDWNSWMKLISFWTTWSSFIGLFHSFVTRHLI